jgi:hypothetical protein
MPYNVSWVIQADPLDPICDPGISQLPSQRYLGWSGIFLSFVLLGMLTLRFVYLFAACSVTSDVALSPIERFASFEM